MEKRTILAFILSFVVLLLWSFLFAPKQEQGPPEGHPPDGESPVVASRPAETPAGVAQPPAGPAPEPKETPTPLLDGREIEVETPLFKAVFSNVGPTLISFKLKRYRATTAPDSPMVELAHPGEGNRGFFSMGFEEGQVAREDRQAKTVYGVQGGNLSLAPDSPPKDLTFSTTSPEGVTIDQIFRVFPDRYPMELSVSIANRGQATLEGNLRATLRNLPPDKKGSNYAFTGVAVLMDEKLEKIDPKKMKEEGKTLSGKIGWLAYEEDYFMSALVPAGPEKSVFEGRVSPAGILQATYVAPPVDLAPGEQSTLGFMLYLGPRDLTILKALDNGLDRAINFGWTDVIAKPLLYSLRFFNQYVKNFGLSIILLTILIKILFWPLTHKSYKSMKEMQKLQPLMAKIREKHKNDKQRMNQELMGLYKTYKVNPMGGCLPMVIQIPVFFALFRILGNSIELRHAPFFLWINDLSAPDRLFNFGFQIPFMSPPYGILVLTILMGASMFIQQKMTPTAGDPTQAKVMMFLPLIFTVMFINFPSGLVLYWLTNNILSIGQQYRIKKAPA